MESTLRFVRVIIERKWFHYDVDENLWYPREMITNAEIIRFLLKRMTNTTQVHYWTIGTK